MTRGEVKKVAFALYKIAEVEEVINDVTVWPALGEDGVDNVTKLNQAMNTLANIISDDTKTSMEYHKAYNKKDRA